MRTTIDLPDALFRELKALAALRGMSLKEIIQKAAEDELATANKTPMMKDKAPLPLIRSKTPGSLHLSNAQIDDLLT